MGKRLQGALLLLFFYFYILLTGSFFWICNFSAPAAVTPVAALASALTLYVYNKIKFGHKVTRGLVWNLGFLAIGVSLSVLVSVLIFDNSYDGQTYHYETITAIANGWNPLRAPLTAGTGNIFYINHYAKGYETAAAFLQALYRHPESGKAINILLLIATFLYTSYFLEKLKIYRRKFWLFFVALIAALNPVTVYQLFTFYVDGQIACLLSILLASLYIAMKKKSSLHLVVAGVVFCINSDIKFTGLVYSILIFGFFVFWVIIRRTNVVRFVITGAAAFAGSMLVGFNPYVTNTVEQSNPFYPLTGKHKIDIITPVQPRSFANKNTFQKFVASNLSSSHNIHGHTVTPEPVIKIPFTFSINEWLVFKGSECRIAGYGPLFGGVLVVSFAMLLVAIVIKKRSIVKEDAFILAILILLTLIINPEMWMSRYVPQLWLFPFCIMWLFKRITAPAIFTKIVSFTAGMITINIAGIAMVNWVVAALVSFKMHKEIDWLSTMNKPVQLVTNDFIAAAERIKFYGIDIDAVNRDTSSVLLPRNVYQLQHSQAVIVLPIGAAKFKNTGILKLLDKKLE